MNRSVTGQWKPFVSTKLKSGLYRTEGELLYDAFLGLLKQHDSKTVDENVRIGVIVIEGFDSGSSSAITGHDWDEVEREGGKIIASRKTRKAR